MRDVDGCLCTLHMHVGTLIQSATGPDPPTHLLQPQWLPLPVMRVSSKPGGQRGAQLLWGVRRAGSHPTHSSGSWG